MTPVLVGPCPQARCAPGIRGAAALALALWFFPACGTTPPAATPAGEKNTHTPGSSAVSATPGATQTGVASYYADSLAGHPTASGEPYDPRELTAAHRSLPFGTVVEITREDGRSVVVRINDRGPFGKKKRIVDLSRAAAHAIGLDREGIATVTLRVVSAPLRR